MKAKPLASGLPDTTVLRFKNVYGINPDGTPQVVTAEALTIRFVSPVTGTAEPAGMPLLIYPNPAADQLRVEAPAEQIEYIRLFDPAGRLLSAVGAGGAENFTVPVRALPRGLVLVYVQTDHRVYLQKVVLK